MCACAERAWGVCGGGREEEGEESTPCFMEAAPSLTTRAFTSAGI